MAKTKKRKFRIALGADHAGYGVKSAVMDFLVKEGHHIIDLGTNSKDSTDYPDYAYHVGKAVAKKKVDRGILACGSGSGMTIAANKVRGVRAVCCWTPAIAKLASEHNWANVICLPSRFVKASILKRIVRAWLDTPYDKGGRHERRVKKISKLEAKF